MTARYASFTGYDISAKYQAEHLRPAAPAVIVDGQSASEQEMLEAMQHFRKYNSDMETYLKWLEFEARVARIDASTHIRLHNDAVDILRVNVDRFNCQLRAHRAGRVVTSDAAIEMVH